MQETLFGQLENRNTSIVVNKKIVLNADRTRHLKIFERFVPAAYKITLYSILNVNIAESIFSVLSKANICKGNSDFQDLNKYKIEVAGPSYFQSPCQDDTGFIQTYNIDFRHWMILMLFIM